MNPKPSEIADAIEQAVKALCEASQAPHDACDVAAQKLGAIGDMIRVGQKEEYFYEVDVWDVTYHGDYDQIADDMDNGDISEIGHLIGLPSFFITQTLDGDGDYKIVETRTLEEAQEVARKAIELQDEIE